MTHYNLKQKDVLMVFKSLIVLYIVFLVFFDFSKPLSFFENKFSKIIFLVIVLVVMYYDLHTGILLTIVFLMILIQLNNVSIDEIQRKKMELFLSSVPANFDKNEKNPDDVVTFQKSVECDNVKKNKISEDIFDYAIDPKVKPYEVFVKMLTTKDHLDNASNSAMLQPEPEELF